MDDCLSLSQDKTDTSSDDDGEQELFALREAFRNRPRTLIHEFQEHEVISLGWNSSGQTLASGGLDANVSIYCMPEDGKLVRMKFLTGHQRPVEQVLWHPTDCFVLASIGSDKEVRLWDVRVSNCVGVANTTGANMNMSWSLDGKFIAVVSDNDAIGFVNVADRTVESHRFRMEANACAWAGDDLIACAHGNGTVRIYSWPSMDRELALSVFRGRSAVSIEFDNVGECFAVGYDNACVNLYKAEDFICYKTICRSRGPVGALSFSYDGKLLASGSDDRYIDIAHAVTGEPVARLRKRAPFYSFCWHPKQYLLTLAACDPNEETYPNEQYCVIYAVFVPEND